MRILHTADWHVGKVLKGRPRLEEEHRPVLRDLVRTAHEEDVDLVLVAGDVFDTAAPTPAAQQLVMQTLMQLNADGRRVVVQAGNHDNPRQLDVFRPLLAELGITVVGLPVGPADGGQVEITTRAGETARLAVLPWVSPRSAVSAVQAMTRTQAEVNRDYADNVARMVQVLCDGFDRPGAVNLLMTHATLVGGTKGGGERDTHLFDYSVPATVFPPHLHYGALGHLHRRQVVPGPVPLHYSGAPLQVDFGEVDNTPGVVVVDVTAETPAVTRDVPLTGGRTLRTVAGTLTDLEALAPHTDPRDWLRVVVREQPRTGLADDVRDLLPGALEVRIDPELVAAAGGPATDRLAGRSPVELFGDYLASLERADAEVLGRRFAELHDAQTGA
ncbi:exonuclease SbcCD subunit D [Nocardioides litoris]|uniref:exonuclease SbcCD subunit D n=1 Tax=Nocardioides litoris TaxID=1926648 RepID=UPI001120E723|nr:exonuclease SbcCD subunit D [Nocardioides litoris]